MVHEIIKSKTGLFLEALILTLLILIIGFALGFFIEQYRENRIIQDYNNFEVGALDLKLQDYYYQTMSQSQCKTAIEQNLIFADKIYNSGLILQKYEDAGELLKSSLLTEKKKQVLLKTELWLNSIVLKNRCNNTFHTVVYFYSQNPDTMKEAQQSAISLTLKEVKDDLGNKIILIPIVGDLGLDSVDMQMQTYNVGSLPMVLMDEKTLLTGFQSKEEIESYLK